MRAFAPLLLLSGCAVGTVDLQGDETIGTLRSGEWIRYTVNTEVTYDPKLTLNYFVLTTVPDFCSTYQQAIADSFDAFEAYFEARKAYLQDLTNPELCEAQRDLLAAMADSTSALMKPGSVYLASSFGYPGEVGQQEEGFPEESEVGFAEGTLEDGDFFRARARFFDGNRYQAQHDALDCSRPDWGRAWAGDTMFRDYVGERWPDPEQGGVQRSTDLGEGSWHLEFDNLLLVADGRQSALAASWDGDYLLCDITTREYFLRIFER